MELSCKNSSIRLGLKEFQMMELFLANPKQILPKSLLFDKIWGMDADCEYNNVEVYVSFLRQKLNSLDTDVVIKTNRGVGYSLDLKSDENKE